MDYIKIKNAVNEMTVFADWIPHRKLYRIYRPSNPQQTIAYVDDLNEVWERGYIVLDESKKGVHNG